MPRVTRNHGKRKIASGRLPDDRRSINQWFDTSASAAPPIYTFGNSGRNILYGPGAKQIDLSVFKSFYIAEKRRLEFRCEAFNALNTPQFNNPSASIGFSGVGKIPARGRGQPDHIPAHFPPDSVSIETVLLMKIFRFVFASLLSLSAIAAVLPEKHLLYVASPGIRNYLEYGGTGILVYDIDDGYRFVKRIPTWQVPPGEKIDNVKGIAASARTGIVYVTNLNRTIAIDAVSGKRIWDRAYEGGCDRLSISPDGRTLYIPQLEGPMWQVVNAANGNVIASIETKSGSHNTIYALDGSRVYLGGLKSPLLYISDAKTHKIMGTVGPFDNFIRPFTVNGSNTWCFVNINGLLGFEIGDIRTGKKLYRMEVQGYKQGPVKRHGCPSHGIALTQDEKELWVVDGANNAVHIFDATVMPPNQTTTIKLRDFPGWISFSVDGRHAYSSTGEIIDAATKKVIATLQDENGRPVQSEKMLDLVIANGKVVRAGNQFGIGMKQE